jgi:hypothetical protein
MPAVTERIPAKFSRPTMSFADFMAPNPLLRPGRGTGLDRSRLSECSESLRTLR